MLGQLFKSSLIKSPEEIELIRESSLIVSNCLAEIASHIKPGITGLKLDAIAEEYVRDNGATPSWFEENFPNTICFSLNSAVVHGIPTNRELIDTDVVSVDIGAYKNEFHGDQGFTFAMAGVNDETLELLKVTRHSLDLGIEKAIVGNRVGDIGFAIQQYCEKQHGYGVVRELVGHGLGRSVHEDPEVPNYGRKGQGTKLKENMVLAIEPMVNLGKRNVYSDKDGWTILTIDNKPSAHYEHDVVVKKNKAEILTDFSVIDEAIKKNNNLLNIVD